MTGQADDVFRVQAQLSRTLYELSTSAGRGLDAADVVRLVAEHAAELVRADAVAVYLWDEANGLLLPVYTNDERQPVSDRPLKTGEGATGMAVLERRTVVVDDYAHFENAVDWAIAGGLKSCEAVPLVVGGHAIGALVIRGKLQKRERPDA